jgi:Ion channel
MKVFVAIVGVALILYTLRDIFHTVFHPSGTGSIGEYASNILWWFFRRFPGKHNQHLPIAGPLSLVVIILTWATLLWVGWALFVWPFVPSFSYNQALAHPAQPGILDALYFSIMNLATLGAADVAPSAQWLRLLAPVEALIGFALLTVSVTWVLSIYPVIQRRQSTANEIAVLQDAEHDGKSLLAVDPAYAAYVLAELKTMLVTLRSDFIQFPITYYFHALNERDSFPAVIQYLFDTALSIESQTQSPALNYAAHLLVASLYDVAQTLAREFLGIDRPHDPAQVFAIYRADHLSNARRMS